MHGSRIYKRFGMGNGCRENSCFVSDEFPAVVYITTTFRQSCIYHYLFWTTYTEKTISTRNSIAIINHLSLYASIFSTKATETYLRLHVSILWSDLESSRMCRWNKIPIPRFGTRSNVYHPCGNDVKILKHIPAK